MAAALSQSLPFSLGCFATIMFFVRDQPVLYATHYDLTRQAHLDGCAPSCIR
jgi:hypothetical protein